MQYTGDLTLSNQDNYINILQDQADLAAAGLQDWCENSLVAEDTSPSITMTALLDDPPVEGGDVSMNCYSSHSLSSCNLIMTSFDVQKHVAWK